MDSGPTKSRVDASKTQADGTWMHLVQLRAKKSQQRVIDLSERTDANALNKLRNITVCPKLALKR